MINGIRNLPSVYTQTVAHRVEPVARTASRGPDPALSRKLPGSSSSRKAEEKTTPLRLLEVRPHYPAYGGADSKGGILDCYA